MFNSKEIYIDKFQYCYKIFKEKYFILLQKPQFPNQITHLDQQQDIFTYDQFLKFLDFLFSYHKLEQARKNPDHPQYTYDRQIAIFFFEKMHKFKINNQDFSSLPNFVKIYFLAEQKLIQKTQEATEIQQILRNERDQLEIKYQEALAQEQKTQKSILNQQKSKKQNYLTVEIEEASVYEPSVLNQFFKKINWNQVFTFNVDRLDSVINIYLMDSKKQSAYMFKIENSEGNLGIPLSSLNSQQKQLPENEKENQNE
ncbi:hypothetical protein PPERSA_09218 [Pseudocohnilembus persalinus]|uniref:Uncharacterized protein n=1 Tax=Pseudocohnilembus persalinus TaxID=266149 RepID=A0A0V0R4C8_PSEPJ|nr:hypothetical protein PPERSA_09218 [Pseudocohnilembus persalinus]|eukprot:KRX09334.1 hypothetical protein PPERSA_09218 [Pseudocohnilembus persalinus]